MANRFGPAGNSESFYAQGHTSTKEQPAWLHAMGLEIDQLTEAQQEYLAGWQV